MKNVLQAKSVFNSEPFRYLIGFSSGKEEFEDREWPSI